MNSRIPAAFCFAIVFLGLTVTELASAQSARRDESPTARLQAAINQLNAENNALQREIVELTRDRKAAESEAEKLRSEKARADERIEALEASLARFQDSNTRVNEALEASRSRMEELVGQFRETVEVLRETESENVELGQQLSASRSDYMQCARSNLTMYETGVTALDALEDQDLLKRLNRNEPFTQLARVRLENMVDEYRLALDDSRVKVDATERADGL